MSYSLQVKNSINGDEYYTLQKSVDMIIPYIQKKGFQSVWCPFDKEDSNFVKTFQKLGFKVFFSHIDTGQDFFDYLMPPGGAEILVSNPPFSKRDVIFEKLYNWNFPFAMIMNFNGLFDSRKRADIFRKHKIELLVPRGKMKFFHKEKGTLTQPIFQSIYVCNRLLDEQIIFDETVF